MSDLPLKKGAQAGQLEGGEGSQELSTPRAAAALAPLRPADESLLPTGFEPWRARLDTLRGMDLLNALLEPLNAEACVQTLPVEDLHRFIFEVGIEDCDQLLALASVDQVRCLIDMEGWDGYLPSLARLDTWLNALLRAGAEVLYERMKGLDDELLSWVLQQNAYAFVVEDPEDFIPPDEPHLLTPDRRFCVVYPREGDQDAPARMFVDLYMQESPEQCVTFLLGATAASPIIIEEEAYRWRSVRMSERGFVPRDEALEVYAPPPADWRATLPERVNEEAPPTRRWLAQVVAPDARLDAAFAALGWEEALVVSETLGYVANMIFSADRVELWDAEAQRVGLKRLRAGLNVALEVINGPSAPASLDAGVLARHHLNYLFRVGYEQMVEAARPVWRVEGALRRGEDSAGALVDLPRVRLLAESLLGEHPEGQRGEPLRSLADCRLAREGAELVEDLVRVSQGLRAELLVSVAEGSRPGGSPYPESLGLGAELLASFALHLFGSEGGGEGEGAGGGEGARALRLSEARALAERAVGGGAQVEQALVAWWRARGGVTSTAPLALWAELRDQVGGVEPSRLDPRFTPILWVEGVTPAPTATATAAAARGGEGGEPEHISLDDPELASASPSEAMYDEGIDEYFSARRQARRGHHGHRGGRDDDNDER